MSVCRFSMSVNKVSDSYTLLISLYINVQFLQTCFHIELSQSLYIEIKVSESCILLCIAQCLLFFYTYESALKKKF